MATRGLNVHIAAVAVVVVVKSLSQWLSCGASPDGAFQSKDTSVVLVVVAVVFVLVMGVIHASVVEDNKTRSNANVVRQDRIALFDNFIIIFIVVSE